MDPVWPEQGDQLTLALLSFLFGHVSPHLYHSLLACVSFWNMDWEFGAVAMIRLFGEFLLIGLIHGDWHARARGRQPKTIQRLFGPWQRSNLS